MEKSPDGYHISFFKPTTKQAKSNRNMVLWLVSVWFIAIFGFHIVLKLIEKPVPEPAYYTYEKAWTTLIHGDENEEALRELAKASLSVLGKIDVSPEAKSALDNTLSWTVLRLTPDSLRSELIAVIKNFEKLKSEITLISDPEYIKAKNSLSASIGPLLGLSAADIRIKIIPLELTSENIEVLSASTKENLPAVMDKYLIHNRSFLTDISFLGFPFHYFYTAFFLLVLFVGLCLLYCIRTDSMNKELGLSD